MHNNNNNNTTTTTTTTTTATTASAAYRCVNDLKPTACRIKGGTQKGYRSYFQGFTCCVSIACVYVCVFVQQS